MCNEIVAHLDWFPTLVAAAGNPNIAEELRKAPVWAQPLQGASRNILPLLTGKTDKSPREGFLYFSDDGDVVALRFDNWKMVFLEQRCEGTLRVWAEPFTPLRVPKMFKLRTDPYEFADVTSNTYYDWCFQHAYLCIPAQDIVARFLATFKDFPPRQKAASFSIDQVVEKLSAMATAQS